VSEQLQTIARELPVGPDAAFDAGPPQVRLMATRAAVDRLCWGAMHYECEACGFGWGIWMQLGVEGPAYLRESGLYIASPFMLGRCYSWPPDDSEFGYGTCGGSMAHRGRGRDAQWSEPRIAPDDVPRFVLPREVWRGDQGADLEIPEPALIVARQWHRERGT